MSSEFGVLVNTKRTVITADAQDADHITEVIGLLHHTPKPLMVRRSERNSASQFLLEALPHFHLASATAEQAAHHGEKTRDVTTVSFEQARAVGEKIGCDWTRLDEVIACFVHARLLMSRERHERYEHAKPSKSE